MQARRALTAFSLAAAMAGGTRTVAAKQPLEPPEDADPALDGIRRRHPGCKGEVTEQDLEAAKGLHVAASRLFELEHYEEALERWKEAYGFDCTAHRLLLNLASAHEREGRPELAWRLRALYVERAEQPDEEIAARVERERPLPPHVPLWSRPSFEAELDVWPRLVGGTTVSVAMTGRARIDALLLELELPYAMWLAGGAVPDPLGDDSDDARAALGNPVVGAHFVFPFEQGAWRAGGRIGGPLTAIDDADWQATALRAAEANAWLGFRRWAPGVVPLSATTAVQARVIEPLIVLADAEATLFAPTGRGFGPFSDDRVAFDVEGRAGLEAGFRIGRDLRLGGGAAAQAAWLPLLDDDNAQVAVDGWLSLRGERLLLRLGSLWALDPPLGFAFERGRVRTVHLDVGTSLH